jgi:hypothetical protein
MVDPIAAEIRGYIQRGARQSAWLALHSPSSSRSPRTACLGQVRRAWIGKSADSAAIRGQHPAESREALGYAPANAMGRKSVSRAARSFVRVRRLDERPVYPASDVNGLQLRA